MIAKGSILLNFNEIRRRSLIIWQDIPDEYINWKPDLEAFSIIEMIRHVLEGEHLFHKIVQNRGNLGDYESPWKGRKYSRIQDEIDFSQTFRKNFLEEIDRFTSDDLSEIWIERKEVNQKRRLGDYLLRIAYHESVHAGQMLSYLRTFGILRPKIWD